MRNKKEIVFDGLMGLLIGDALGVPYEFNPPSKIPPKELIEFDPPKGFLRTYIGVPAGTWSDDGAQALCLLDSLVAKGGLNTSDLARKLIAWLDNGLWAVDGRVFDCGNQTRMAIYELKRGTPPARSGFCVPDGKGNGALMRVLPLALYHNGSDSELIHCAHAQAVVTHGHICNQVCCAFYCLWARNLLLGADVRKAYSNAAAVLRCEYGGMPDYLAELDLCEKNTAPGGTGYVIDSFISARHLLFNCVSYEDTVKEAVLLGNDTDTTAAIAGGLAGIAFGGIPERWLCSLRDRKKVEELLDKIDPS